MNNLPLYLAMVAKEAFNQAGHPQMQDSLATAALAVAAVILMVEVTTVEVHSLHLAVSVTLPPVLAALHHQLLQLQEILQEVLIFGVAVEVLTSFLKME